jgi:hypothetical protein
MNLNEIGYEDVDWINLTQDRIQPRVVMVMVMDIRVTLVGNFWKISATTSFSRNNHLRYFMVYFKMVRTSDYKGCYMDP